MSQRVLTMGTFDMFHVGHLELLKACRDLAGYLGTVIVGVNTDEFVELFKGKRPIVPVEERADIIYACRFVDDVFLNAGGDEQRSWIRRIQPDIIAVGDDWKDLDYLGQLGVTQAWLDEHGIEVVYVPRTTGVSSTALRDRAAKRALASA